MYAWELSGGLRQRAMIAMALSCGPNLLIADEPTTAIDVTTQAQVLSLLSGLQQHRDMAIIFITHDLGVIAQIAEETSESGGEQVFAERERDESLDRSLGIGPGCCVPPQWNGDVDV